MKGREVAAGGRIFVIDSHPVVGVGVAAIVAELPDGAVVGHATRAGQALRMLTGTPADLILLDVRIGEVSGFDLCRELLSRFRPVRVVLWATHPFRGIAEEAAAAGAHGFLPKDSEPRVVREVLSRVIRGDRFVVPPPAPEGPTAGRRTRSRQPYGLTHQETRVLELLPRGLTNRQIGHELGVSDQTVKTHLSSAMRKLNVASRVQATAVVVQVLR